MIEGYGAVTQALLGTLFTWGMTAAGAGLVVFLRGNHVSLINIYSFPNLINGFFLEKDS